MKTYFVTSKEEEQLFLSLFKLEEEKRILNIRIDALKEKIKPIKKDVVEKVEGYDLIMLPDKTIYHKTFKISPSYIAKEFAYYIFKKEKTKEI
jgi:hypothetical protein